MTREKYESLPLATLKELAKARKMRGVSTLKKGDLIDAMLELDEQEEQKEAAEPVEVVPDAVDGECQYCAGNKDIETNDGSFHLHLTRHGTGRIELDSGLRYGIIEFSYCPMCGRKMEE